MLENRGAARLRNPAYFFRWEGDVSSFIDWADTVGLPRYQVSLDIKVTLSVDGWIVPQGFYIIFHKQLNAIVVDSEKRFLEILHLEEVENGSN